MAKHSFLISKPIKEPVSSLIKKKLNNLPEKIEQIQQIVLSESLLDDILINANKVELKKIENKPVKFPQLKNTKTEEEIIQEFSLALVAADLQTIGDLLADTGVYVTINSQFDLPIVNKKNFLIWIERNLNRQPVISFSNDFCDGCFKGKSIMFYNNGAFPWNVLEKGFGRKTAFKFQIKNNKISTIRFCHNFVNKQNKMDYPKYKELYAKYRSLGYDLDDTARLSKEEWNK
jgi:hypothetical protein